jgi:hypothetical protein
MSYRLPGTPVTGKSEAAYRSFADCTLRILASCSESVAAGGEPPDDFGRLVGLVRSNEGLTDLLGVVSRRLRDVRAYLAQDGCNPRLGQAYYLYWRTKHSGVLQQLRANRLEARRLLARIEIAAPGLGPIAHPSLGPTSPRAIQSP